MGMLASALALLVALCFAEAMSGCEPRRSKDESKCIQNSGGEECAEPPNTRLLDYDDCPLEDCNLGILSHHAGDYRYVPACNRIAEIAGRTWSVCTPTARLSQPCAECYATALDLCGQSDWRLPTPAELESLYDRNNPACTHTYFAARICSPFRLETDLVWSAQPGVVFGYYDGTMYDVVPDGGYSVLVVRP
jgi:hypothetical protein